VGSSRGSRTRRGAGGADHARLYHDRLGFFARQRLAEAALHCLAALDSLNPFLVALAWTAAFAALASLTAVARGMRSMSGEPSSPADEPVGGVKAAPKFWRTPTGAWLTVWVVVPIAHS
jgi:hypothetical protein